MNSLWHVLGLALLPAPGGAAYGGLLTLAAVEDMLAEAHDSAKDRNSSLLIFASGYARFIFVSAGLGGA